MVSVRQRGRAWQANIARRGVRTSATFDTEAEARAWAAEAEQRILGGRPLVDPPPSTAPRVSALFARYAREVSPAKGGARWECVRLLSLPTAYPLFDGPVDALDAPALADWRDARLAVVAPSTVNRELNLISAVLNKALKEWRVPGLTANPVHAIQRPRDPAARVRRVSDAERDSLCARLGWDRKSQPKGAEQWIAWSVCLAIETAMRKGELLALTWPHVHLARLLVHLPRTKNGHARDVPLTPSALALFGLLEAGKAHVVPVASGTFDVLFRRARDAVGLGDLHFHDTRREGTTRLAEKLGLLELAASTGHQDVNLLRRTYYQPDMTAIARKLG